MEVAKALIKEDHVQATRKTELVRLRQPDDLKADEAERIQILIDNMDDTDPVKRFLNIYTSGHIASLCVDAINTVAVGKNWNGHAAAAGCAVANFASMLYEAEVPGSASSNFRLTRIHTSALCGAPRGHHDNIYTEYMSAVPDANGATYFQSGQFELDKSEIVESFERGRKNPSVSSTTDWITKYRGCPLLYGEAKSSSGESMEGMPLLNVLGTRLFGHSDTALTMHSNDSFFRVCRLKYEDRTWAATDENGKRHDKTADYVKVDCYKAKMFDVAKIDQEVFTYDQLPLPPSRSRYTEAERTLWMSLSTQVRVYLTAVWETMDVIGTLFVELGDLDAIHKKWKEQWEEIPHPRFENQPKNGTLLANQRRWRYGPGSRGYWLQEKARKQGVQAATADNDGVETFRMDFTVEGTQDLCDAPTHLQATTQFRDAVSTASCMVEQHNIQNERFKHFLDVCKEPMTHHKNLMDLLEVCLDDCETDDVYCAFRDIQDAIHERLSRRF